MTKLFVFMHVCVSESACARARSRLQKCPVQDLHRNGSGLSPICLSHMHNAAGGGVLCTDVFTRTKKKVQVRGSVAGRGNNVLILLRRSRFFVYSTSTTALDLITTHFLDIFVGAFYMPPLFYLEIFIFLLFSFFHSRLQWIPAVFSHRLLQTLCGLYTWRPCR